MELVTLRPITSSHEDLEFVRALRNNYRQSFFDTCWILDWQQMEWYARIKRNPRYHFYILEHIGFRVGTISKCHLFDITFKKRIVPVYELGNLMLLYHYQGRGFMHSAIQQLKQEPAFFIAYVKPNNKSSINVFEKADFGHIRRDND